MSRSALLIAAALAAACGAPRSHPSVRPDRAAANDALPAPVVALRAATGGDAWDRVHAIATTGTIAVGGMTGTIETVEDVTTGRSKTAAHVGPLEQASGFDGERDWERAPGGEVASHDAPDSIARARTGAWMTRRGYLRAGGARWRDLGARDDRDRHLRGVEATPDGGAPIALWIDDAGLLALTTEAIGRHTVTTTYGDWRDVGGVKVPFHVLIDQGDDARNDVTITATKVALVDAPPAAAFAAPATDDDRMTIAGGADRTTAPFELVNNHIYVRATVDGQPVRMLLDTGGANVLTPSAAKRLGLTTEGNFAASGAGEGQPDMSFARGKALALGDATLRDPVFFVIDLGALSDVEGEDFDGLIGFEFFSRLGVTIDYPASQVTLTRPAAFTAPAGAAAIPFELADRIPIVHGAIDGVPGRFWIDTGSRVSLTTMTKFTHDHDLEAKYKPRFTAITGWGVGGATSSAPVRFHEVTLGTADAAASSGSVTRGGDDKAVAVHDVVGDLFTGAKSAMADPDAAGNLGGGILHRFVVGFDYAHRTMYLQPGPAAAERERYDESGLFLIRVDGGKALRVIATTPTGPAEAAGVVADDVITAIDGEPVAARKVSAWRARLRDAAPGTKVTLTIAHEGGKPRKVAITLAELVP